MHRKPWLFFLIAFLILSAVGFKEIWAFWWIPMIFFIFAAKGRHGCWGGWHHSDYGYHDDYDGYDKPKGKPKRKYIETEDGDILEVIDEPQHV